MKQAVGQDDGVLGRPFREVPDERDYVIRDGAIRDRKRSEVARLKPVLDDVSGRAMQPTRGMRPG